MKNMLNNLIATYGAHHPATEYYRDVCKHLDENNADDMFIAEMTYEFAIGCKWGAE